MTKFQRLIRDLTQRADMTEQEIADSLGIRQSNVSYLKLRPGAEPRWTVGDELIKLHKKRMRRL